VKRDCLSTNESGSLACSERVQSVQRIDMKTLSGHAAPVYQVAPSLHAERGRSTIRLHHFCSHIMLFRKVDWPPEFAAGRQCNVTRSARSIIGSW
jgi:hypothetical protein